LKAQGAVGTTLPHVDTLLIRKMKYRIMERFCLSVDDEDIRDDLCNAIRGRGAFRYFKDRIHAYGIAEEWYRYRDAVLREIAMAWCEAHGLRYTET
jgi:Uncharacterised protein family (UPF0158)